MNEINFMRELFFDSENPLDSPLTNLIMCIGEKKLHVCYINIINSKQRLYEIDIETRNFRSLDIPVRMNSEHNYSLIHSMCYFPSKQYLVCGCSGGVLMVININTWSTENGINKKEFSSTNRRIRICKEVDMDHVILSDDRILLILRMVNSRTTHEKTGLNFDFECVGSFRKHQKYRKYSTITEITRLRRSLIASASGGSGQYGTSEILIWNWKTLEIDRILENGHSLGYKIQSMKEEFSSRGHIIFSSAYLSENKPCEIVEWDFRSCQCLRRLMFPETGSKVLFGSTRFALAEKKVLQLSVIDLLVGKVTNLINLQEILKVGKKAYNREMLINIGGIRMGFVRPQIQNSSSMLWRKRVLYRSHFNPIWMNLKESSSLDHNIGVTC